MKQLIDHVQMDAFLTYKKERNNEFYTVIMSLWTCTNNGIEVTKSRQLFAFDGACLENIKVQVMDKWLECKATLEMDNNDSTFSSDRIIAKKYRNCKVVDSITTYNLIKKA